MDYNLILIYTDLSNFNIYLFARFFNPPLFTQFSLFTLYPPPSLLVTEKCHIYLRVRIHVQHVKEFRRETAKQTRDTHRDQRHKAGPRTGDTAMYQRHRHVPETQTRRQRDRETERQRDREYNTQLN